MLITKRKSKWYAGHLQPQANLLLEMVRWIKSNHRKLPDSTMPQKCLHGTTQSNNESLNGTV
jgi:hypothetical protein